MDHPMEHDVLSVSMFWAGALMAFAPLAFAGIVLVAWRRWLRSADGRRAIAGQSTSDDTQARGSTTRPK
jgi:hypothetical protein